MRTLSKAILTATLFLSATAHAQVSCDDLIGNGSIGLYADLAGTQRCTVIPTSGVATLYIIAELAGASSGGITGAEFRVEAPGKAGYLWISTPSSSAGISLGDPIDDPATESDPGGCNIGFPTCQGSAAGDKILLYTVQVVNISGTWIDVSVKPRTIPNSPLYYCPLFSLCDYPEYSKTCLTPTLEYLGRDPVASCSSIRTEPDMCPSYLPGPPLVPLGIYADSLGLDRNLCAPVGVQSTFHLVGVVPGTQPPGVTGAEFRIEIENSAGYSFEYLPPQGTQVVGDVFDYTPSDSTDYRGAYVSLPSCSPADPSPGKLVDFGKIRVMNISGQDTRLRVRRAQLRSPTTCARFFKCDAPFNSPICMTPVAVMGTDIVFEGILQTGACGPPFEKEILLLNTHTISDNGGAGPVLSWEPLDHRSWFLVSVRGTVSLSTASSWYSPPNVVCGLPETAPMTLSPSVTNYWVGTDAEVQFAATLPSGGDCGQAPLGHHQSFEIDLGSGFQHLVPLGGQPESPTPGHVYRYLVQGQDQIASFRWVEPITSDNYGVLTITVEQVIPTDVSQSGRVEAVVGPVRALPNVPDPFNPSTLIRYTLASQGAVTVEVFDVRGYRVRRLFEGVQSPGVHEVTWDGRSDRDGGRLPSGAYFARISSAGALATERMILLK